MDRRRLFMNNLLTRTIQKRRSPSGCVASSRERQQQIPPESRTERRSRYIGAVRRTLVTYLKSAVILASLLYPVVAALAQGAPAIDPDRTFSNAPGEIVICWIHQSV